MGMGFGEDAGAFARVIGWELYQVTIDKYHVMFWFENGHALLNVASKFSFRSADGATSYTYSVYGQEKELAIDRVLRSEVRSIAISAIDKLDLTFANGDTLTVCDDPKFRSWWFIQWDGTNAKYDHGDLIWSFEDADPD